jgi:RNA polymerase sigma-70 factor (ECF subfamily)
MEYSDGGETQSVTLQGEMAFEQVFKAHFKGLHAYAYTLLKDDIIAEEMVQNVFCRLWEKKEQVQITESVAGYLYRSVYNESLNYLKHLKVRAAHQSHTMHQVKNSGYGTEQSGLKELQEQLHLAMQTLPEQCRLIFQMSRYEELKYHEIASRLGLSVKTIENQMGKALKILRTKLADFLPVWLLLMLDQIKHYL